MKQYIFITDEGFAYQPDSESGETDIENFQVIGFASGNSPEEAAKQLLMENERLKETTFNEIIALELKSEKRTYHCLKGQNENQ